MGAGSSPSPIGAFASATPRQRGRRARSAGRGARRVAPARRRSRRPVRPPRWSDAALRRRAQLAPVLALARPLAAQLARGWTVLGSAAVRRGRGSASCSPRTWSQGGRSAGTTTCSATYGVASSGRHLGYLPLLIRASTPASWSGASATRGMDEISGRDAGAGLGAVPRRSSWRWRLVLARGWRCSSSGRRDRPGGHGLPHFELGLYAEGRCSGCSCPDYLLLARARDGWCTCWSTTSTWATWWRWCSTR